MSDDSHAPIGNGWDGTYQRTEYGYNRQGNLVTKKDPNETVHEYAYDGLGRQIEDAVTTFGAGIDEAVKRITTTYEARGMVATVTSHDALSGGSVLNEVAFAYDDFGQLREDAQAHGGAVDGSTPRVLYGYADGSTDNTARRLTMTYPDGRVIDFLYGDTDSLDNHLSRIAGLKVDGESQDLVTYSYVGAARYVKIAYPEPGIELSYIKNSGEPERDSGDPYTGYDRFGRTVDMKWQTPDGASTLDRVQYGYDRSSSRTWRRDLAAPAGHDEFFRYDALHQVTDLSRGNLNLNQTAIGGIPVFEETFDYDPTGNWNRYTAATGGTETLDQTRVNNRDSQITQLDGSNEGILYDRAGQALQMPPDVEEDWSEYYRLVWDAWGRLVEVKDGSLATVAAYAYDGTTRRITKTVGGTTIHSYYNERWKAIEEREDSSSDPSRQYLWGARPNHRDELVRSERDSTGGGTLDEMLYCLMDYYDPIAITDPTGEVVERYEFSAFGLRSLMDGAWAPLADSAHAIEFAFHGQFLDAETGYYNYGYRYYQPETGRWASRDPIGESGGVNIYAYSNSNAINVNDYLGANPVRASETVTARSQAIEGGKNAVAATLVLEANHNTEREYTGSICSFYCADESAEWFFTTKLNFGGRNQAIAPLCPPGWTRVHTFHSHSWNHGAPSDTDRNNVSESAPGLVARPYKRSDNSIAFHLYTGWNRDNDMFWVITGFDPASRQDKVEIFPVFTFEHPPIDCPCSCPESCPDV